MDYVVLISPECQADIESIYDYISQNDALSAKKQIELIYSSIETLETFPQIGEMLSNYTEKSNEYRFISIKKTYIVFYTIDGNKVHVVRTFRYEQDFLRSLGIE